MNGIESLYRTACDIGIRVLSQTGIEHGIRHQIAEFVGVSFVYRLGAEQKLVFGQLQGVIVCGGFGLQLFILIQYGVSW